MLCAVVCERTVEAARSAFERFAEQADIFEVRLDALDPTPNATALEALLRAPRPRVIVTNRGLRDHGGFTGSEADRIATLVRSLELGADHIDVELDAIDALPSDVERDRVVASWHDFDRTPPANELDAMRERLEATGAGVTKLVTFARMFEDNQRVLDLPRRSDRPMIALCMGDLGRTSRLLSLRAGGWLTFGSIEEGRESAPGQIPLAELRERFDLPRMTRDSRIYGILGHGIGYSLSPAIHNRAFADAGDDAVYLAFDVEEPRALLAAPDSLGIHGLSVTIPHKETVRDWVVSSGGELDDVAREIGAVNTLVRRDGAWRGVNTDGPAVVDVLRARIDAATLADARLLILGAGGVARSIAWAAAQLGLAGAIASRDVHKGRAIADPFGLEHVAWDARHDVEASIVCNATPIGSLSSKESSPYDVRRSRGIAWLFDTIYVPHRTRLLAEGLEAGIATIHGIEMFGHQAAAQSRIWTGRDRTSWFLEEATKLALPGGGSA